MATIDHKAEAERLIAEGRDTVRKISDQQKSGNRNRADDYGKKAIGCWAQAQVEATLYLAEQQRLANIIAMATWNDGILRSGTLQYEDAEDEATERIKIDRWFAEVRLGVRAT